MRQRLMRLHLAALFCLPLLAQVPAQDSRNTNIPNTDTHFTPRVYQTLAQWEARRAYLRKQILSAAGLLPLPVKNDLHAQIFGRIENRDYSIEKVLIETLPGYYLGGNLYRPLQPAPAGGFPAVVSPHGHWNYGRLEHTTLASIPARAINLARQGYVVFAYDQVGTTTPSRRRTNSAAPRKISGASARSACSSGTGFARWISWSRFRK